MNKEYSLKQLKQMIMESSEFEAVIGKDVDTDNKKNNEESYKNSQKKAKDFDGGLVEDYDNPKTVETDAQKAADIDNLGMERLKYDVINEPFKEKVQAQIMGKASTLQQDIDDKASGVSTKGNEKFLKKSKETNKFDNDHKGVGNNDQAIVQLGTNIAPGAGHPKRSKNAFESKSVKVGDVFVETKNNLKLKLTGVNEEKTKVLFIEESSNKKYSITKTNFSKALNEGKILREMDWVYNDPEQTVESKYPVNTKFVFTKNPEVQYIISQDDKNGELVTKEIVSGEKEKWDVEELNKMFDNGTLEVVKENKVKRLNFKKDTFINEDHMKTLIPEDYKIHGNKFYMKDVSGNEYLVEWNANSLKPKAVILEYRNDNKATETMSRMKDLWGYNSSNVNKTLKGVQRIEEQNTFGGLIQKMRELTEANNNDED